MSTKDELHHRRLDAAFVGGLAWTAGAKWVTQLVSWVAVVIAARLLSPSDFGMVEMAGFVVTLSNVLAEFGVGSTVLQMRELDRSVLAQLNTISLLFCTFTFGLSVAVTPLVAAFFRTEQLKLLMIINSLSFFITAVQAVPLGLLQRDMDYRRLSLAEAVQSIVQAVVTIGCAVAGVGYWSLLIGPLTGKASSAGLTAFWKPVPFRLPRWKEIAKPLRFGFEIVLSRVAWTAYSQADGIIVGRMLGESALGTYRLAMSLASAPAEKIGMLIMRVTGPLFARVQEDVSLTRRYFLFITDGLALVICPLVFGLIVVAPELVRTVLGAKWAEAIVPMQWLAIFFTLRTMNSLMTQVLTSLRFTTFLMWISLFTFVLMPISFFVAAHWGTGAVAAAWLITSPFTMFPPAVKLFREIHCSIREYLAILTPAIAGSAVLVCAVIGVQHLIPAGWPSSWRLVLQIITGGVGYAGTLLVFYRPVVMRYVHFFWRMREGQDALVEISV
jgi:teichuronic acid exporter